VGKEVAMTCLTHDGDGYSEALDYGRLEQPWRDWAKIAKSFSYQLDDQSDREDLMHDIIVELYKVAEKYREMGKPLTRGGCILVAEYRRLHFYHQKKRWKRVSSFDLNSIVQDEDGNETEFINTLVAQKGIDQDTWIDAKSYYENSPKKVRRAIRKLLNENWRNLSGYDWKLIKRFREEAKQMAVVE
jgi:hypothetical protein